MPDPAERFIEAAVSPLGDNAEMQVAGRRLLEDVVADIGKPNHEVVEFAVNQLSNPRRLGKAARTACYAAAFAIFASVAAGGCYYLKSIKPMAQTILAMAGEPSGGDAPFRLEDRFGEEIGSTEQLLLFGDLSQESKSLRWKALWDRDPERPAFFADYALAYIEEHKTLPPDFLDTGERLAPGNGWFAIVAAGVLADQATDPHPRTEEEKKAKAPRTYELKDESKLREALSCLSKAAAMPHFKTYQRELLDPRVRLLPTGSDVFGQIPAMMYMATARSPVIPLVQLPGILHVECDRLSDGGDRDALERLVREWDAVVRHVAETEDFTLIDGLVKLRVIQGGYEVLAQTSKSLKSDSSQRLQERWARFDARRKAVKSLESQRGYFKDRAGFMAGISLPMISRMAVNAPEIRDEDLQPGRWAEHEFLSKALAAGMAAVLAVLAALVAAYRFRGGELRRRLSVRLAGVLAPADWAWILGAGVALPFSAFQLIARLPLLGGREWSIHATKYLPTCGLFSLGMWLLILLPVLVARWRLAKRAGFAGIRWKSGWIGWWVAVPLIIALPFAGVALLPSNQTMPVTIGFLIVTQSAQIWAWVVVLRGIFSRQEHLLKRLTLSRVVVPAYVSGMLLLSLAALASHQLERHWIQQDRLMEVAIDQPSMSRYEYQVTQAVRQEILDILKTQ